MLTKARQLQSWSWRVANYMNQDMSAKAQIDLAVYQYIREELAKHLGEMDGRTILDVGTGPRYQLALLFQSFGCQAYGIDIELVGPDLRIPFKYVRLLQQDGYKRTIQVLARDVLSYDRNYFRSLEKAAGVPLLFDKVDIRTMSVSELTYPDKMFDAIVSTTVFEHVSDVPGAVREMARVLKDDGIIYIVVHLYTSLSGGHHPAWAEVGPDTVQEVVPAWDHLRKNAYPAPVYLNKLRIQDYEALFSKHFELLSLKKEPDLGWDRFLTPEIEAELNAYSREELSCKFLHIVARKRPTPQSA